jgi:hypothetical protein
MCKVYSFRLDEHNPREVQVKGVIQAWVGEGYSLQHVVVEALIAYKKEEIGQGELASVVEQFQDLILSTDRQLIDQTSNGSLPNSFLAAVKQSARDGVQI